MGSERAGGGGRRDVLLRALLPEGGLWGLRCLLVVDVSVCCLCVPSGAWGVTGDSHPSLLPLLRSHGIFRR